MPREVKVTVTASPAKGLDATLGVAERLAGNGYEVVPHVSARLVRDRAHAEEIAARLHEVGIREVFVPAGDAAEPGQFPDAASLLRELGGTFDELGITGYPESHHLIPDEVTIQAMFEKAPHGDLHRQPDLLRPGDDHGPGSRACATAAPSCRSGSACPASSTTRGSCGSR